MHAGCAEGAIKRRGVFTNCLQLVNHTSVSSLPIKDKSSDGLTAEVLTGPIVNSTFKYNRFNYTIFAYK